MLKHQDSATSKNSDVSQIHKSLKSRIISLRKRKQNLECAAYENNTMDLIQEEKEQKIFTVNAEKFKKDVNVKLLEPFRRQSKPDQLFATIDSENILNEEYLKSASLRDKNNAFLLAAFKGDLNYLKILFELGAEPTYADVENLNALHLASIHGSVECCTWLLSKGCPIQNTRDNLWPMHFAAKNNSVNVMNWLLSIGCEIPSTVLHDATSANAADCVLLLLQNRIAVNAYDSSGKTALHIAADLGHSKCLEYLLEDKRIDVNARSKPDENTALHYAAKSGYLTCLQYLLAKHAFIDATNDNNRTALHLTCSFRFVDCVRMLLMNGASVDVQDCDGKTPLHASLSKSQESLPLPLPVVRLLVEWKANVQLADTFGFTPLHVAAVNELEECVEYLIMNGANVAAKTKGGVSALNFITRKTPVSVGCVQKRLNLSLSYSKKQTLKLNFRDIINNSLVGETGYLYTVQQDLPDFLNHPLCRAFLHLKWQKVRSMYLIRIFISLSVICLLSFYILMAITKECHNNIVEMKNCSCTHVKNNSLCNSSLIGNKILAHPLILNIIWYTIFFIIVINITRICFSFAAYKSIRQYFSEYQNLLELLIIFCVFILSMKNTDGKFYDWQNIIGALTVLLSWIYLMALIGQLPFFGTYITMFTKVLQEFSKMLAVFFCLLVGFTITFCILLKNEHFENPARSFVKIIAMMAGEIDFTSVLHGLENTTLVKYVTLLVLSTFIVFVTIVLMNLLVGIAVQDVEGLRNTADESKLVQQMKQIYFLELACFHGCFPQSITKIFRNCFYTSPGSYRVSVSVRPFDPQEKTLPKDIMEDALKIALNRTTARLQTDNKPLKIENRIDNLEKQIMKLNSTITDVNISMEKIREMLQITSSIYWQVKSKEDKLTLTSSRNTL